MVLCKNEWVNLQDIFKSQEKKYVNSGDLFAKALIVEKPWFVDKVQFDQVGGKLEIWIDFKCGSTIQMKY